MSSASQPKSQSPEREPVDSPQARELQPLSCHLDGVPSNSEPDPSPALPQGREMVLVAPDVPTYAPALEAPFNSEPDPSLALPQGREMVLVAPDVPTDASALEAPPLMDKRQRRASRRRAEWTPPEGMQTIVQERKSGKSKGNRDTYYTLPGVSTIFRSIPEVQRYLEKKPIRIWKKNSGTQPSQPAETESPSNPLDPQPAAESCPEEPKGQTTGSFSNPLDPQPAAESCPEEPKGQTNDEERAEGPKSRPKVCVQRNLFKRSRRHKRKNL